MCRPSGAAKLGWSHTPDLRPGLFSVALWAVNRQSPFAISTHLSDEPVLDSDGRHNHHERIDFTMA